MGFIVRSPKIGRLGRTRAGIRAAALSAAALVHAPAGAIVGGTDLPEAASRPAVMVLSSRGGMCSAVVVAPDVVLTAAHCVAGSADLRVHFRQDGAEPALIAPAARAVHPGYDAGAVAGRRRSIDLALLRLPEPLPARFPAAALAEAAPGRGAPILLGGYGLAREGDPRSTGTFRTARAEIVEPYGRSAILLWAADPRHAGAGGCEGDSGGPMSDGSGKVVAVTSWAKGAGRASCGQMTQGVLVAPQRSWIDATLRSWSREALWR